MQQRRNKMNMSGKWKILDACSPLGTACFCFLLTSWWICSLYIPFWWPAIINSRTHMLVDCCSQWLKRMKKMPTRTFQLTRIATNSHLSPSGTVKVSTWIAVKCIWSCVPSGGEWWWVMMGNDMWWWEIVLDGFEGCWMVVETDCVRLEESAFLI